VRNLEGRAFNDGLTGVLRRERFIEVADELLLTCEAQRCQAILLYLDMDGFKEINDKYGHAVGDLVLKTFSRLLVALRPESYIGRMGGDEFAIISKASSGFSAMESADILKEVLELGNYTFEKGVLEKLGLDASMCKIEIPCRVSVGYASSQNLGVGYNVDKLLLAADNSMYDGKRESWIRQKPRR